MTARVSNREKILSEGLKAVHAHGFANTSVRDIVAAAGVPQGSFTNNFESKEAFGVEILDLYFANGAGVIRETLRNDALPPLKRLRLWLDRNSEAQTDCARSGCLIGNFTAEAANDSEALRTRLNEIYAEIRSAIAYCLKAAVKGGELPRGFDCETTADFIFSGMQGAVLIAKAERTSTAIERFKKTLFAKVLR